ncbi:hypothetical protein B224_0115 [Aeromonas media WS]|nr:hypothetical protein B224_0115 [Aeromonas media WS]
MWIEFHRHCSGTMEKRKFDMKSNMKKQSGFTPGQDRERFLSRA